MSREVYVRFSESARVKFPRATQRGRAQRKESARQRGRNPGSVIGDHVGGHVAPLPQPGGIAVERNQRLHVEDQVHPVLAAEVQGRGHLFAQVVEVGVLVGQVGRVGLEADHVPAAQFLHGLFQVAEGGAGDLAEVRKTRGQEVELVVQPFAAAVGVEPEHGGPLLLVVEAELPGHPRGDAGHDLIGALAPEVGDLRADAAFGGRRQAGGVADAVVADVLEAVVGGEDAEAFVLPDAVDRRLHVELHGPVHQLRLRGELLHPL